MSRAGADDAETQQHQWQREKCPEERTDAKQNGHDIPLRSREPAWVAPRSRAPHLPAMLTPPDQSRQRNRKFFTCIPHNWLDRPAPYPCRVHRRATALLLAISLTVLMVFAVAGTSILSGPVLLTLDATHGIHRDDLIALAAYLFGLWCAWALSRD